MVLTKVKWSKSLIVYFWGSPKNNGTSTGLLANLKSKSLQDHIQENAGRSQDHVHEDTQDMEGQTDVEVEIVILRQ